MTEYEVRDGEVILYARISRGSGRYYIGIPKHLIETGILMLNKVYEIRIRPGSERW